MRAVFINRNNTSIAETAEALYFFGLYLLAESSAYNAILSFYVGNWNCRDEWDIDYMIGYIAHNEVNKEERTKKKKELMASTRQYELYKKIKHKNKEIILFLNKYQSYCEKTKKAVLYMHELSLRSDDIWNWRILFDGTNAVIDGWTPYDEEDEKKNEDRMLPYISNLIHDKDSLITLYGLPGKYFEELLTEEISDNNSSEIDAAEIISLPLCNIPFGRNLTADNMMVLRKNILGKFKNIAKTIEEFRLIAHKENFGRSMKEKTIAFHKAIKSEIIRFQSNIDDELYFQQIINSDEESFSIRVRLGISSIDTMISFYEKSGLLLPFVAEALKKNLSLKTDLNLCEVFLYFDVPEEKLKIPENFKEKLAKIDKEILKLKYNL